MLKLRYFKENVYIYIYPYIYIYIYIQVPRASALRSEPISLPGPGVLGASRSAPVWSLGVFWGGNAHIVILDMFEFSGTRFLKKFLPITQGPGPGPGPAGLTRGPGLGPAQRSPIVAPYY